MNSILSKRKELTAKFSDIDVNNIQDAGLRAKAKKLKARQGGFTLLELLVVVAILAAIAGTATLALQDTDARAAAAAHVAMMDELNKGIRTYKALNKSFPNNFDSLIQVDTTASGTGADRLQTPANLSLVGTINTTDGAQAFNEVTHAEDSSHKNDMLALEDVEIKTVPTSVVEAMGEVGLTSVRVVDTTLTPEDGAGLDCTNLQALIGGRTNAVVAGNIFLSAGVNGCGVSHTIKAGDSLAFWTGGSERITGVAQATDWDANDNTAFMVTGVGPGSDLFNTTTLGGMTSVPVYRHVSKDQYNRFMAIYAIGTFDSTAGSCAASGPLTGGLTDADFAAIGNSTDCGTGLVDSASASATLTGTWTAANMKRPEQVQLVAVVDGAGDTKEEELGEWDGTRNTI